MTERLVLFGRKPTTPASTPSALPDWAQANPTAIDRALARALAKPSGGWRVLDSTREIRKRPRKYAVAGSELVAWMCHHDGRELPRVGPDFCPHMGAELSKGHVDRAGRIVCPWHGLAFDGGVAKQGYQPFLAFDDGVLTWVRVDGLTSPSDPPTPQPFLAARPTRHLDAVIRMEARCTPSDVIANRLDPWHGAHFHPHSFARLRVLEQSDDAITVRVAYRVLGRLCMEVDARFDCPDANTIVMTIVSGEGVGSVVETHATPMRDGHTAIVEATLATTERGRAMTWLPRFARVVRPLVESRARRLWIEDVDYCERRDAIRRGTPG